MDFFNDGVERCCHELVDRLRLTAFDKIWLPSIAPEELFEVFITHAAKQCWIGDLVAIQVQDGKYSAISRGIQKLVRVPTRGQRPRFRLAVADHAAHQKIRISKRRPEAVGDGIPEFAALVD